LLAVFLVFLVAIVSNLCFYPKSLKNDTCHQQL